MKKLLFVLLYLSICSITYSQGDIKNIAALLNQGTSLKKQELPNLTSAEIKKLFLVNNGYVVLNSTTGCINYFFNSYWYELCGNCIPAFDKPSIVSVQQFSSGNEILLKDTAKYLAVLFPDSISISTEGKKVFIKKPLNFDEKKKYVLRISNMNDRCDNRPILDTAIHFTSGEVTTSVKDKRNNYSFSTVSAGAHFWLAEPVVTNVKDETVCIKTTSGFYYNWTALNKDPLKPTAMKVLYSANVCPSGFRIPAAKDVEELVEYNQKENVTDKFKLAKAGFVVPKESKKEDPTDNRFFFMLADSNHPEAFQTLLISGNDIRIATLPRDVYVQILCVSE